MTKHRLRLLVAVAAAMMVAAACSSSAGTSTTTAAATTASPPTSQPSSSTTTSTSSPGSMTQQQAYQVVFTFDPVSGDSDVLAAALEVAGAGPGLGLPILVERGSPEVQAVVLNHLRAESSWGIATLVAMQEYGMPSGTHEDPKLWSSSTRLAIAEALRESSGAAYGPLAEMMIDLNRRFLAVEIDRCVAEGCEWGAVWYAVPEALAAPLGTMTDATYFEGTVTVVSDTGAGDESAISVRRLEGWVPVAGFLAEPPAFGLASDTGLIFDGSIVTTASITLSGWAESGTTISSGGEATLASSGWWELPVMIPNDGVVEIVGEQADGATRTEKVRVRFMPEAEQRFGYIIGVEATDSGIAIVVDYAEWLTGDAAVAAAREDGVIGPDDLIENDFYIRNQNPMLRTIPLANDAAVRLIDSARDILTNTTVPVEEFVRIVETGDDFSWYGAASEHTPFWFVVVDDTIIHQVSQQYLP